MFWVGPGDVLVLPSPLVKRSSGGGLGRKHSSCSEGKKEGSRKACVCVRVRVYRKLRSTSGDSPFHPVLRESEKKTLHYMLKRGGQVSEQQNASLCEKQSMIEK